MAEILPNSKRLHPIQPATHLQMLLFPEIQVAEHPALASLRHALIDDGIEPLTVENGIATPVLIMGVERSVATDN